MLASMLLVTGLLSALGPSRAFAASGSHKRIPIHGRHFIQHQPLVTPRSTVGASQPVSAAAAGSPPLGGAWQALGPRPISGLDNFGNVSGRITALAAKGPVVYAGAADGGVWKSTDSGATWAALTDSQPTLAIGAVAVQWGATTTSDTIYAGTGEGNECEDCLPSDGVIKSADGGSTWSAPVSLTTGRYFFNALALDRTNGSHLMAATTAGLYESSDGGSTWAQRQSGKFDSVVQDPSSATKFWASETTSCAAAPSTGVIGIWDTSGGGSWTAKWNGSNPSLGANSTRIAFDIGGGGAVGYGAVASCGQGNLIEGQLLGLLRTTDGGATWSTLSPPDYFSVGNPPVDAQGWYDNVVGMDPNDSTGNSVVFGGITMLATANGTAQNPQFVDIAHPYSSGPVHADFHAVAFTAPQSFYTGNDGGVYFSGDLGGTGAASDWTNKNATLNITQFYNGSSADLTHLAGGSQDNGTAGNPQGASPAAWKSLLDGDGFWTAMIPGQSTFFGETSGLDIYQLDYNGAASPVEVAPCPNPYNADPSCSEPTDFVAPFVMDPTSSAPGSARLYAATTHVYRTVTGGLPGGGTTASGAWSSISGSLVDPGTSHPLDFVHTMAVGGGNTPGTVMTGSWFGKVYYTADGRVASPNWVDITGNLPAYSKTADSGNAWITAVAVNPLDNTEAWVSIGTLTGNRIWHTNNAGSNPTSWVDISTTLPTTLVIDSIVVDPIKPQNVYIGTDAGAMACATCGGTGAAVVPNWVPLGTGLPNVRVDYISVTHDDVNIVAWTHGRGAWTVPRPYPTAGASLQPSSLDFGSQTIDTTSPPQTATLQSTGTAPLAVTSIAIGGSAFKLNQSSQTNPCPAAPFSLAPGSSCSLGIVFTPTTINAQSGTLAVYDNGVDSPQTTYLNGTGTAATSWESLGGSLSSSPAATSWGASRIDLFARGQDLALYHMWWDGSAWHSWSKLGGTLSSDPVAISWGQNRLDVFARGQDLALYHMWSTDGGATWQWWTKLGGTLSSNPGASTWGTNRMDLYAAGQDKALYHMWTSDGGLTWNSWTKLGGTLSSDPAAASWGVNRLDVFARGQDLALYHMYSTDGGTTWQWWAKLSGSLSSSPAASTWGANRLDVVALGQDKALYHMWSTDGVTFNSWQPEGGSWTLNPTATSRVQGVVDAFARGTDTALWHKCLCG